MKNKFTNVFFGRSECAELKKILSNTETVEHLVYGFYNGGRGILVATNKRILLIDKRSFFVNVEEFLYDLLHSATVDKNSLLPQITLVSPHSKLTFKTVSDAKLKKMSDFISDCSVMVTSEAEKITHMASFISSPYRTDNLPQRRRLILPRRRPIKYYSS